MTSESTLRRHALAALALLLGIVALMAALAPRALAVSDSEELFSLKPGLGGGAGEVAAGNGTASSPITGHFYIADGGSFNSRNRRIAEFTPWGTFVKAFGWDVAPGAVNEQQELRIRAAGGQFRLIYEGATTPSLAFDAPGSSAEGTGSVEAALNALATIGGAGGSVTVTGNPGTADGISPFIYVVTFKGSLAASDVPQLQVEDGDAPLSGGQPAESQVLTRANGGPAGVGLEACTTESGCRASTGDDGARAGEIGNENIGETPSITVDSSGNIYVVGLHRVQKFAPDGTFLLMFGGNVVSDGAAGSGDLSAGSKTVTDVVTTSRFFEVGQVITGAGIPPETTISAVGPGTITLSKPGSASGGDVELLAPVGSGNVPMNTRQTIGVEANSAGQVPTGGTFTLTFETPDPSPSKQTTAPISLEATASEVESSLGSLLTLTAAEIDVTGPAGGPWTVEFSGPRYGNSAPPPLQLDPGGLTPTIPPGDVSAQYKVTFAQKTAPEVCEEAQSCRRALLGVGDGEFAHSKPFVAASGSSIFATSTEGFQRFGQDGTFEAAFPSSGGTPIFPDAAPSGDVYAIVGVTPPAVVRLSGSTGAEVARLPLAFSPAGLTSDSEGNVYTIENREVVGPSRVPARVVQYSPALEPLEPQYCCQAPLLEGEKYWGLRSMSTNAVGALLVHYKVQPDFGGEYSVYRMIGPGAARLEAPPRKAPDIEAQFATSVGATNATVAADISPEFWSDAHYRVEYGTEPCSAGGCNQSVPADQDKFLTTQSTSTGVRTDGLQLEGLQPNTTYYFRFVAESSGGGPVRGVGGTVDTPGSESSFTTYPTPSPAQVSCPNQAFRTGASAALANCRAYEMVSPVDKAGGDIKDVLELFNQQTSLNQGAIDGSRFTFTSYRAFGPAKSATYANQYLASRGPVGWATEPISPPLAETSTYHGVQAVLQNEYKKFSPDLCTSWLTVIAEPVLAPGVPEGYPNLYRRDNCGPDGFAALIAADPVTPPIDFETELQGTSADGSIAVVRVNEELTGDAVAGQLSQVYAASNGSLQLVCVLPDGAVSTDPCSAGTSSEIFGAFLLPLHNRAGLLRHAISEDGSKIYWTQVPPEEAGLDAKGRGSIYLRLNPTAMQSAGPGCEPGKACTVEVSGAKSPSPARFLDASEDGSKAIYEFTAEPLAGNLYMFDLELESSTLLAKKSLGLAAVGGDLSEVYFVSEEKLSGTTGATVGKPNLYLAEEGSKTFIATLSRTDVTRAIGPVGNPSNTDPFALYHAAQASEDGRNLAFISTAALTGYDNTDVTSPVSCGADGGVCDSEVFMYQADHEALRCVSCNPSGARPRGRMVETVRANGSALPTAASLGLAKTQLYTPRVLTPDGSRLFFNSYDALVLSDTNDKLDVYEWQAASSLAQCESSGAELYVDAAGGCLSLVSSGKGQVDSEFLDSSESGDDVFFRTGQSLVSQDPGLIDVYDARVGGGFPPHDKPRACEGEGCQGIVSTPAAPAAPGSRTPTAGNPRPKCPKGTHRVIKKGKPRCVKNKRAKKRQGRSARDSKRMG